MLFLASVSFLMYAHSFAMLLALAAGAGWRVLLHMSVVAIPMFAMGSQLYEYSRAMPIHRTNWVAVAAFAFGVASAAIFGWHVVRYIRGNGDYSRTGWRIGLSGIALLCGVYLACATMDHWWFYRGEQAGMIDGRFLASRYPQLDCPDMVLFRMGNETAVYRCPTRIFLGGMTVTPFVPWPAYVQGESAELKRVLDTLMTDLPTRQP